MKTLENFVAMMYDRSSTADGVGDARLDMPGHTKPSLLLEMLYTNM